MTVLAAIALIAGCQSSKPDKKDPPTDTGTAPLFVDLALSSGYQDYALGGHFKRGRGCTIADLDNDGRPDIYVSNPEDESFLLRNVPDLDGSLKFKVAAPVVAGELIWGAVAGDYDNDGDLDLFLSNGGLEGYGYDRLYRNELVETGALRFVDVTDEAGVAGPVAPADGLQKTGPSVSATWVDYDNDGDVDLFVDGHVFPLFIYSSIEPGSIIGRNTLWRNEGDGTFVDVTWDVGLDRQEPTRFSSWLDYDNDGDLDLFENNWVVGSNVLWRNQLAETGAVQFEDVTAEMSLAGGDLTQPPESFVSITRDFNNDGWEDLLLYVRGYATDGPYIDGHTLLLNAGGTGFVDASEASKLNSPFDPGLRDHNPLGVMGAQAQDVNGDGLPDVYIGNGGPRAGYPDQLFVTTGLIDVSFAGIGTLAVPQFDNWSEHIDFPAPRADSGAPEYPPFPYRTHGTCIADLDGDGQMEIAVTNGGMKWFGGLSVREPNRLFSARIEPAPQFVRVRLVGDGVSVARDAIGGRIAVTAGRDGETWVVRDTVVARAGFSAQNGYTRWFGLADADEVVSVQVDWPDGTSTTVDSVALGATLIVER